MAEHLLSSVLWSLLRTWGGRLAGFVIYFQLARLLSPVEMGLFSAAFAVFVFLEIFVDQGMVHAIVQRPQLTSSMLSAVLVVNVGSACLIVVALNLLAHQIERWLGTPHLAPIIQVGSLTLLFTSLGFCQEAVARRQFQFRLLAIRTLTSTLLGGVVGVVMAARGHGVWALVAQLLVAAVVNVSALWLSGIWRPQGKPDFSSIPELAHFGIKVLGTRLVEFAGSRGIELLVAAWLGAGALGFFAVGSKIHYIFLQLVGSALVDVAQSGFSRLAAKPARLMAAHLSAVGAVSIVSFPVWIIMSACAPEICAVAFGPKWHASAAVLAPLALMGAVQVIQAFDATALSALGRPGLALTIAGVRAAAALTAVTCFHNLGLVAVAQAYAASTVLVSPLSLWLLKRHVGTPWRAWISAILPAALASALMWAAITAARSAEWGAAWHPMARFLLLSGVGACTYVLAMLLSARQRLKDLRSQLRQMRQTSSNAIGAES